MWRKRWRRLRRCSFRERGWRRSYRPRRRLRGAGRLKTPAGWAAAETAAATEAGWAAAGPRRRRRRDRRRRGQRRGRLRRVRGRRRKRARSDRRSGRAHVGSQRDDCDVPTRDPAALDVRVLFEYSLALRARCRLRRRIFALDHAIEEALSAVLAVHSECADGKGRPVATVVAVAVVVVDGIDRRADACVPRPLGARVDTELRPGLHRRQAAAAGAAAAAAAAAARAERAAAAGARRRRRRGRNVAGAGGGNKKVRGGWGSSRRGSAPRSRKWNQGHVTTRRSEAVATKEGSERVAGHPSPPQGGGDGGGLMQWQRRYASSGADPEESAYGTASHETDAMDAPVGYQNLISTAPPSW